MSFKRSKRGDRLGNLLSYKFRGLITFVSDDCEPEMMCLFTSDDFRGEIITRDEGELEW